MVKEESPYLHLFKFEEEVISANGVISLSKINKCYK